VRDRDPARAAGWIAEPDGAPSSCVFRMADDEHTARPRLLLVEPAARGSGLGGRLVDECVAFALRAGGTAVIGSGPPGLATVDGVRFAISIPQYAPDGSFDPRALREYLARAEQLGFESAWTVEQVLGTRPQLGPTEVLTFAAALTGRIRLGCAVYVTPLHHPVQLAKSLSTLDQLSGGRLEVGVGTGGRHRMFSAFGVDPDTLVARFTEGIRLMKALWVEPTIDFDGRFWRLDGAAMEPKPAQQPHPPLWFGGHAPAALRRAVRLGDGFFGAGSTTTDAFVEQVGVVREALTAADRDPATFGLAKRVYLAVDDDAQRARRRMTEELSGMYGPGAGERLLPVTVVGPPEECAAGLSEVTDAGAELLLLNPLYDEREQMERLVAEVLPLMG
jgi:probable F420-dependent oxidoreductase